MQRERYRSCTLSSASKISPMDCGHPGFPVLVVSKSSQEVIKVRRKSKTQCTLLFVKNRICALNSTCETSPMERRHPENFLLMWCQELSGGRQSAHKLVKTVQLVIGMGSDSTMRTLTTKRRGWPCRTRSGSWMQTRRIVR